MPGYTHLQRAQPISFAQHLLAYANMLCRDVDPFGGLPGADGRMSPGQRRPSWDDLSHRPDADGPGSWAFRQPMSNSLDGVSDRDYVIELLSGLSILMMHLSRLCRGDDSLVQLGISVILSWTTPIPPAPPSCRRRRTPMWQSWSGARRAGSTATLVSAADHDESPCPWPIIRTCRRTRSRSSTRSIPSSCACRCLPP